MVGAGAVTPQAPSTLHTPLTHGQRRHGSDSALDANRQSTSVQGKCIRGPTHRKDLNRADPLAWRPYPAGETAARQSALPECSNVAVVPCRASRKERPRAVGAPGPVGSEMRGVIEETPPWQLARAVTIQQHAARLRAAKKKPRSEAAGAS